MSVGVLKSKKNKMKHRKKGNNTEKKSKISDLKQVEYPEIGYIRNKKISYHNKSKEGIV